MPFVPKFIDLVRNSTTTVGTADFVLGPAVNGYTSFATALQVGDSFYYSAIGVDKPAEREVGRGTLLAGGLIAREPIGGVKTNFTGGAKSVALIAAAEWFSAVQGAPLTAASRGALSSAAHRQPTILSEAGREGLFAWDGTNLAQKVAVDGAQGIYIAPASDPSGASGAWVRRFSGPIDIRWFGAVADCTSVGVGTDNAPAINAAKAVGAARSKSSEILIPMAAFGYRVASTLKFTEGVKLVGQGFHENPGIVGGTSYPPPQNYRGSLLVFDRDVAGIQLFACTDNLANAIELEFESSTGSILEDMMLYGGGGTLTAAHGIESRTYANLRNVRIENFAGNGVQILAYMAGPNPYGNASLSKLDHVFSGANGCHGFYVEGADANICTLIGCNAYSNGGVGFLDKSLIGNSYFACHATSNNQSHGAATPQRTKVIADWPGLSDISAGSYVTVNGGGAENAYFGCYTEIGRGAKAEITGAAGVFGGLLSEQDNHTANSAGVVKLQGDLRLHKTCGNPTIHMGGANYAHIQLEGSGSMAWGLDILAGFGSAYLSADQFILRNAAQNKDYAKFSASGLTVPEVSAESVATPSAGTQTLFIDSADHKLKRKDSTGIITTIA